jgi:AGZA family xanthine/uracil permease-like MFS transporter
MKAAAYALVAAVLSFFGFIHGAQLAWMASPMVALGYVLLGAICLAVGRSQEQAAKGSAKVASAARA